MSPRQFAALAVTVARHAEDLSAAGGPDPAALHRVWKRSAQCFHGWREELVSAASPRLYAELFAAELPLRIWCTAVDAAGRSRPGSPGPAVAGKVFSDLLDLRCMALRALAAEYGLTASEAAAVDRFRRRCERWTDVLVGPLADRSGVTDYAARPDRAADFVGDPADPLGAAFWPLATAGLSLAFTAADGYRGPAGPRDAAPAAGLAAAITSTFPASAFRAEGVLRSSVLARVGRVVDERRFLRRTPRRPPALHGEPAATQKPPVGHARPLGSISFASFRKRRGAD